MNVQNLRDNYLKLIAYMEESGYSACYTQRVRREIDHIFSGVDSKNWASYIDIYLEYAKKNRGCSEATEKVPIYKKV